MKPLFPRPIPAISLYNSTNPIFQIANFSNAPFHPSHNTPFSSRRHEAESRRVKVSVWWDFENCNLPTGSNVFRVTQSITAAIRANGIKGPIQITAFGDVMQMSRVNQEALSSTGISFTHVPNGGKNRADRSLLVDLMYWVSQNPPPAHLFLISGDRDFAGILHRLRMNNYNILLASLETVPSVLSSAASIMWQWNTLIRGENLTGKHFNQPPDGPYGSWYGHYKAPLEDPFVAMEQPTLPCTQEPSDSNSDLKLRPIPKAVQKQILHILCSKPRGISSKELRAELDKSNLSIDKDFYGYKKFSCFLLAMPNILKLQSGNDGQFLVRGVCSKASEQNGGISRITAAGVGNAGEPEDSAIHKLKGTKSSCTKGQNPRSGPSPYSVPKMKTSSIKLQEPQKVKELAMEVQEPSLKVQQSPKGRKLSGTEVCLPSEDLPEPPSSVCVTGTKATGSQLLIAKDHNSLCKPGFLRRLWEKWFGNKVSDVKEEKSNGCDKISGKKTNIEDLDVRSTSHSEACVILVNSGLEPGDKIAQSKPGSETHEIFSKVSFWKDMVAFLDTAQGSALVLKSRTRLQMAQNLQKQCPFLGLLRENDLLHLVDLLISDTKLVEGCLQKSFPFKLSRSAVEVPSSISNGSAELNSIFLDRKLTTDSENSREHGGKTPKFLRQESLNLCKGTPLESLEKRY